MKILEREKVVFSQNYNGYHTFLKPAGIASRIRSDETKLFYF